MAKSASGYKITENTDRFAFFKLLCLNLEYIYAFQEKFAGFHQKLSIDQFSNFFNEKYKAKLDFLIKEKNKALFEHLNIFNAYADINPVKDRNFYLAQGTGQGFRRNDEFRVHYAKRTLGEQPRLKESFSIVNKNPGVGSKDKTKAFVFGFAQEYGNLCLNEIPGTTERNAIDGAAMYSLADETYRISFLDFFIMQTLALQISGLEGNTFPGSDILQLFSDEICKNYLAAVSQQALKVTLPLATEIAGYDNEIYNWAMGEGRKILEGKTYKYEKVPALAFLAKAGNFKFSYKNIKRNSWRSSMETLVSGEYYKDKAPIHMTLSRAGQSNSLTYCIEEIAFEDLLRVRIGTERTGPFLKALAEQENSILYEQNLNRGTPQNKPMPTQERLTYLLPMLAAQIQNEASLLNYGEAYELLRGEIEFFRNCTALFNCFMEKNKTALLVNTL